MIDLFYILFFFLGAMVGSFLHVAVLRLHTGRTILTGRSKCDSCAEELSWYHLVPLFSFVFLGGRCGMCGSKIGFSHIIAEVLTGALFVGVFIIHGISPLLLVALPFVALVVAIILYDLRHTIIPNQFVYPLIILGFGAAILSGNNLYTYITALGMSVLFGLIWLLSRGRAMGFGDAKLILALALFVGYPLSLSGFLLSFWLGAVISVGLLVIQGKRRTMGSEVPFAPYLALGFLCAYLLNIQLLPLF